MNAAKKIICKAFFMRILLIIFILQLYKDYRKRDVTKVTFWNVKYINKRVIIIFQILI